MSEPLDPPFTVPEVRPDPPRDPDPASTRGLPRTRPRPRCPTRILRLCRLRRPSRADAMWAGYPDLDRPLRGRSAWTRTRLRFAPPVMIVGEA